MSGRLVGEVAEWLCTPASDGLTVAERAVLLTIAERSNEKNREMWRHRGDTLTLFERICKVTGMDRSGLTKALRRLAAHGVEVRVQIGTTKAGAPVFAHRGTAMRFHLPELPASVQLPERVDEEAPISPVDNPPEDPSSSPHRAEKGWTRRHPNAGKGASQGTQTGRKGGREGTPNTSKDNPSTTDPSSCGSSTYVADVEDTPPAAATPSGENNHRHMGWEPDYIEAREYLLTLADEGQEFMNAAAIRLGPRADVADRVIHAAKLAKAAS